MTVAAVAVAIVLLAGCSYEAVKACNSWQVAEDDAAEAHADLLANLDAANAHLAETHKSVRLAIDAHGNVVEVWASGTTPLSR